MKGFAENLTEKYSVIHFIRMGEQANAYGDPWEVGVICASNDGETAMLIGYYGAREDLQRVARAAILVVRCLGYVNIHWERKRPEGFHLVRV